MSPVTGISASQRAQYTQRAADVINRFDTNRNGTLERNENERYEGRYRSSYSSRYGDYVTFTTVVNDRFSLVKADAFAKGDANRDGKLTKDEMVEAYLVDRDSNRDGKLSSWEKFKMGFSGVTGMFQTSREREVDRSSYTIYDPLPEPPRPTPPYAGDRPTPPSTGSRPTPPSTGSRPTPPSTNSGRPTPPPIR